jgi:hypothetical protein
MEFIGPRISVVKKNDETNIVILSSVDNRKKNILGLWLFAWTICGVLVFFYFLRATESQVKLALFIWLCFWIYFEYVAAKAFRWRSSGVEKIRVKNGYLHLKKEVGGKGKNRLFEIDVIKELRLFEDEGELRKTLNRSYWVVGGETLAFDYFGKTVRFGRQLEEKEANALMKLLKQEMKTSRKKAS